MVKIKKVNAIQQQTFKMIVHFQTSIIKEKRPLNIQLKILKILSKI